HRFYGILPPPGHVPAEGKCEGRRPHGIRCIPAGFVQARCLVRAPTSAGRQAGRTADRAGHQAGADDQSQDRQDAGAHNSARSALYRRRGDRMRRREFITLIGGAAAAWPLAAHAQLAPLPRIGIIDDAPMWHSFRQALRELGYVERKSVNYEYRYSEGVPDRLAAVVGELVRRPVDLIAAYGTPPAEAAKAATTTIPIVMIGVGDPVRAGLVASFAHPGGNITGNTVLSPDLGGKRLQLLREAIPTVMHVAYRINPDSPATRHAPAEIKPAAAAAGMALLGVEFGSASDFDAALAVMLRERTEVLLVSNDPLHQLHVGRIIDFLAKN